MRWIQLEDIVPYAFIISLEHNKGRKISSTTLMKYAHLVASSIDNATLLVYRDLSYEFFNTYSEYFIDHDNCIELKNSISIKALRDLAFNFLTLDLVIALQKPKAVEVLLHG